jgi:hypothetical protein
MEACLEENDVENTVVPDDRSMGQELAVVSRDPLKRRAKDDFVHGNPEGRMFDKRRRTQPEYNNGIRNQGLKEQLHLEVRIVRGGVQLRPLGTSATNWSIVSAPGDYEDRAFGEMMIGRGN